MNNLATMNTNDFTITQSGEAFISQREISRVTGIPLSTVNRWILEDNGTVWNVNENNQLDAKSFQNLVIMGHSKYPSCLTFMTTLVEAGAKAYIYHEAGYVMEAKKPKTKIEILNELVAELNLEHEERLRAERKLLLIGNHLAGSIIGELGNDLPMNLVSKILATNLKIDLGQNMLMRLMRKHGWLMSGRRSIKEKNLPMQGKIKYMRVFLHRNPLTGVTNHSTVLTQEGVVQLCKVVLNWYTEEMK